MPKLLLLKSIMVHDPSLFLLLLLFFWGWVEFVMINFDNYYMNEWMICIFNFNFLVCSCGTFLHYYGSLPLLITSQNKIDQVYLIVLYVVNFLIWSVWNSESEEISCIPFMQLSRRVEGRSPLKTETHVNYKGLNKLQSVGVTAIG